MEEKKEYEQISTNGSSPIPPSDSASLPQQSNLERMNFTSKIASKCLDFLFSENFAKLLEKLTKNFYFWFLYLLCTLAEPILCAYYPTAPVLILQIFFLVVNTCFFLIEIYGTVRALRENWKSADSTDAANQIVTDDSNHHEHDDSFIKLLRWFSSAVKSNFWARFLFHCMYKSHGEHVLSFLCLLGGWIFIFIMPGVAILRCFRVFRMLWLYEKKLDGNFQRYLDKIHDAIGKDIIDTNYFAILGDLCEFSIKSLTALGSEMFRLTSKTRGGLFLMLVFFYFSYLFGAMYYVETGNNDWNQVCTSVGECMYIMMRLAFFDGTGLDFANDLGQNARPILFFMSMVYLTICAFGLLNGLIGIFGTTFRFASRDAFKKGGKRARLPAPTSDNNGADPAADIGNDRESSLRRQHSATPSVFTDFLLGEIFDEPDLRRNPVRTVSSPREFLRGQVDTTAATARRPPILPQRASSAPVTATIYPSTDDPLSSGTNPAAESHSPPSSQAFDARLASPLQGAGVRSTQELQLPSIRIAVNGDGYDETEGGGDGGGGQEQGDSVAIRQLQDDVRELKRDMARIVALLELIADNADIDDAFS